MFITMLADMTAFVCLVFGYFFFWTVHDDFPPDPLPGPDPLWILSGGTLLLAAWALTLVARKRNRDDAAASFYVSAGTAVALTIGGGAALILGPLLAGLDPTHHVYQATVWILICWTVAHAGLGIIMLLYCVARRVAGKMTAAHGIDIANTALYWHFCALTVFITTGVIAGFPFVA